MGETMMDCDTRPSLHDKGSKDKDKVKEKVPKYKAPTTFEKDKGDEFNSEVKHNRDAAVGVTDDMRSHDKNGGNKEPQIENIFDQ